MNALKNIIAAVKNDMPFWMDGKDTIRCVLGVCLGKGLINVIHD